jgi:DNA invertase Pin-like site-specific DNA recombinase
VRTQRGHVLGGRLAVGERGKQWGEPRALRARFDSLDAAQEAAPSLGQAAVDLGQVSDWALRALRATPNTPKGPQMTVDGYIRVSKVRGRSGASFISPAVQRERIERYAALRGHEVGLIHEELDESGGRADRPKLLLALERIEARETGGLIVAKLDRFGRSLLEGLAAVERIKKAGGVFASVDDGFDLSTDSGQLSLKIMLALAEFELARIRGQFADARARAVARGIHPCPVPPVGYRRRDDGGLEPDPFASAVVSELFSRAAEGESWADLARLADAKGLRSAYGARVCTSRAVREMVRNRVYRGQARHGEYTNDAAHEPLTDEGTWQRAQRRGARVSSGRSERPGLLAGLVRCSGCRYGMHSYFTDGQRFYRCHRVYPGGRCPQPVYISGASGIDEYIEQAFFDAVGDIAAESRQDGDDALADLDVAVRHAKWVRDEYRDDDRVIAELGMDSYLEGLAQHNHRLQTAEAALSAELEQQRGTFPMPVTTIQEQWANLTIDDKRKLLGLVFDAVFVFPGRAPARDRVHLCLRGQAPDDLPRRGRRIATPPTSFVRP